MFKFGKKSADKLASCESDIQAALNYAMSLNVIDFTILYGYRSPDEQMQLFSKGRKLLTSGIWIVKNPAEIVTYKDGTQNLSKHNYSPARAVDIAPYINGKKILGKTENEMAAIYFLSGIVCSAFASLKIPYRWGGNWDGDGEILTDQKFNDLLHFELK